MKAILDLLRAVNMASHVGWERCRIIPSRFLAECRKRRLDQGLHVFCVVCFMSSIVFSLSIFLCTVLFVSISQVIDCEDRLRNRNDIDCI